MSDHAAGTGESTGAGTDPSESSAATRAGLLTRHAAEYARIATATVTQEYPNYMVEHWLACYAVLYLS